MINSLLKIIRGKFTNWLQQEIEPPRKFPLSDFERLKYEIRPCDVLLIESRTRVSRAIRIITQSIWSHSALYIGRLHDIDNIEMRKRVEQMYPGDPSEQLIVESLLGKGIVILPLSKYRQEHIRICRPHGFLRQDAQKVIDYVISKVGQPYATREIFDLGRFLLPWSLLPRRWRSTLFNVRPSTSTRESCSSLLAEAFKFVDFPILPILKQSEAAGIELLQRNPRLFTPSDFDYSPFFEIIKYPIIELSEAAAYRKLPWNKASIYSNDEEKFPEKKQTPPTIVDFFD